MSSSSHVQLSALLTLGRGPVARATFDYLRDTGSLRAVALARPIHTSSIVERIQAYGIWYSIDKVADRVYNRRSSFEQEILRHEYLKCLSWQSAADASAVADSLVDLGVQTLVVSGFPFILKTDFLDRFETVLNVHPSVLPEYRGPEPVVWGIVERSKRFGITVHHVDSGIDTGAIVSSREFGRPLIPLSAAIHRRQADLVASVLDEAFVHSRQPVTDKRGRDAGTYRPKATLENRRRMKQRNHT